MFIIKSLYFIAAVNSVIIVSLIVFPKTYVRDGYNESSSSSSKDLEWPTKIEISPINYVCDTPTPNMEIKEDVVKIWNLSNNTKLSPIMFEMGRCEVAAKIMKSSNAADYDTSKCRCVQKWP